jgi:hypothetical protein
MCMGAFRLSNVLLQIINIPFIDHAEEGRSPTSLEFCEDNIQDHVYQAVLKQSYGIFKVCCQSGTNAVQCSWIGFFQLIFLLR